MRYIKRYIKENYYNVYIEAQAGFRKGIDTTKNIIILQGLISYCIKNNDNFFAAFVDFQKAFDYIMHCILWFELVEIGVRGKNVECNQLNLFKLSVKNKV